MPDRWVDEKLNNTANRGCMFLLSFVFFGMLSIQGCFIGQLVRHHAKLYNRITDIEKRIGDETDK